MTDAASPTVEAPPKARRFTLGDAMILVAALGLSLVVLRLTLTALVNNLSAIPVRRLARGELWNAIAYRDGLLFFGRRHPVDPESIAFWFLVSWEYLVLPLIPAYLAIRLRRPRPPLRRLIDEPGVAALAGLLLGGVAAIVTSALGGPAWTGQALIAAAIPSAWVALRLSGRWRRGEPRWIGRMGLVVGGFWSLAIPLHLALTWPRR